MKMLTHNSPKFFIVDDDPFSRMLYRQHLLNLGYKDNLLFENGKDCINKLNLQPDIVMLDYDMEPFNGLDVLQMIKKFNPNIQLFFISGVKDSKIESEARKHGAIEYIIKGDRDLEMISKTITGILQERAYKETK